MKRARFADILDLLAANEVDFIVVGMTAGVLHGAPVTTIDLDCLGTIDEGRGYDELLEQTVEMSLSSGRAVRVLTLPALIEAKERSGRPKDLAALPVLRATLDEQKKHS